ncbi:XRE family transcriptional regulator [Bacteroides sp. 214]|uniref:helix-turn-helix domain-containing protein n=1 Tax=Bacteroides sp. 214 TaxID=2302935 RepID=UPI0013D391AB|nr:helix-turn-helix transcriptional regulator [Bacteroides sp. 214]NDW12929.1 XRE family transcriptional regulator [Bacteroides sp. 214]
MGIKERMELIMESEKLTSTAFAERINVVPGTLSHIFNGRSQPSLNVVMKISKHYPNINLEWLLKGVGEMYNQKSVLAGDSYPSLFDLSEEIPAERPSAPENRKEMALETPKNEANHTVIQEVKYIERPPRKITEIRIFFDDNTYETFKGEK